MLAGGGPAGVAIEKGPRVTLRDTPTLNGRQAGGRPGGPEHTQLPDHRLPACWRERGGSCPARRGAESQESAVLLA